MHNFNLTIICVFLFICSSWLCRLFQFINTIIFEAARANSSVVRDAKLAIVKADKPLSYRALMKKPLSTWANSAGPPDTTILNTVTSNVSESANNMIGNAVSANVWSYL